MHMVTDSPFYRVSVKALIFDSNEHVLVFQDADGDWEMPGGGLEHGETIEEGITRELYEEMRVVPSSIGSISFVYSGKHEDGFYKLFLVVPVQTKTTDLVPTDDNLVAAKYVSREEFSQLGFGPNEVAILEHVDQIWPHS